MTPSLKRRFLAGCVAVALPISASPQPVPRTAQGGGKSISASDLKTWLTAIASDEFEGRATFTEGLGLAASYLAQELRSLGVKPGGDSGSYFQRVAVLGVKATNRSTVTVTVNGASRTFKDGEGITFPRNVGGKRTLSSDQIEFVGYGATFPAIQHDDFAGKSVSGKVMIFLGPRGPKGSEAPEIRRLLGGRARYGTDQLKAVASIGPVVPRPGPPGAPTPSPSPSPSPTAATAASPTGSPSASPSPGGAGPGAGGPAGFGAPLPTPDFITVQRLDQTMPPVVTAQDEFFEFLFSGADVKYAELKAKAANQEPLPNVSLKGVSIAFGIDADYQIVRTQFTRNVVGIVEGSDPKLKDAYVAFGAHYDHQGYAEGELVDAPVTPTATSGKRRLGAVGGVNQAAVEDRIWNGADDDGSGTVVLLSLAKAFATGPKPKRSLLFVWHSGEERGLLGSRYYADYPTVPVEKIVAHLNMDMVGRNRRQRVPGNPTAWEDIKGEADRVYLVGSDRISTELHNISEDANASASAPLKLDYEMNDPADPEQVYYRSDHYSYAAKGVPIIFYSTGLHDDYHVNTDSVEKITFDKMARITQLIFETGRRVANLDHAPLRDNKGPRAGKGSVGKLAEK